MNSLVAPLRFRDYRFLWVSTLGTSLGFWMEQVAVGWLILELSDSAFLLGVSGAARTVPWLVLGMVAGTVADRLDRRALLLASLATQVIVNLLMFALLVSNTMSIPAVLLLILVSGSSNAFLFTARQAYITDIVGSNHLASGIALNQVAQRAMGIPGALAGGAFIAWVGMTGVYALIGSTYLVAFVFVVPLARQVGSGRNQEGSSWSAFIDGLRLISRNRTVAVLFSLAVSTEIFAFSHISVLPIFASDVFGTLRRWGR
ncbi:MAG: MFS transporter [Chloroflexi bacterium]|nr:MFS transporter [Chloroflexota bacterium]